MSSYEEKICEAIDKIVSSRVANAPYDKTIKATIIECTDATIGKYKVKYQDSHFYAYAGSSEITYRKNAEVYVLVPGNDMKNDKTILGTTEKLGVNYAVAAEGEERYEVVGKNTVLNSPVLELCSYKENYSRIIYDKNLEDNILSIDKKAIEEYLHNSSSLICAAKIKTSLPVEQQFRGNYGLIFELNFLDNATENIVQRQYVLDVNQIEGNPYKITLGKRQVGIFDIDTVNFIDVNKITIFNYGFPNISDSKPNDIIISEIEICGSVALKEDELATCALTFITPQGTYFDNNDLESEVRKIQAQVRVKGKIIDNKSQLLDFYWFKEDLGITTKSEKYCAYGGRGWRCLNKSNIVADATETESAIVEWIPEKYEYNVIKKDVPAKETRYKCAVIYDNVVLTKEVVIKNMSSDYNITIESDSGTQFYYDIGSPNLVCKINDVEKNDLIYKWALVDSSGDFNNLEETVELNDDYNNTINAYNTLEEKIKREEELAAASKSTLDNYKVRIDELNKNRRVERNRVFNVPIYEITGYATYKCAVYKDDTMIGVASIVLTNDLEATGMYNLVINNGSQVFKYNVDGVAPTNNSLVNPLKLTPLSFTLYDNLGNEIDSEIISKAEIEWCIPMEDTLLVIPSEYGEPDYIDLVNKLKIYKNLLGFSYSISNKYYISKQNNNIILRIKYKDMNFIAKTNFTFAKEGEPGTNGTEFLCKIVPNTRAGYLIPQIPMVTVNKSTNSYTTNWTLPAGAQVPWFKVQLWHSGQLEFENSFTEGDYIVKWEVLRNKYGTSVIDETNIRNINVNNSIIDFDKTEYENPANIIKCTVTFKGIEYYSTIPIIVSFVKNDNYKIELKDNTGFMYATYSPDGRQPQYDNANPFELNVQEKINNFWEEVSELKTTYSVEYEWLVRGKYYDTEWHDNNGLVERNVLQELKRNQKDFKPKDDFNGYCVSNAIYCSVSRDEEELCNIHIPVHMLLNKYGNAAINGWDGNSVSIDENDSGVILAPQVGAGRKEADNSFTGVLMGTVKEVGKAKDNIGLLGYSSGSRTIFLNSESGSAIFGNNNGQIVIDPTQNRAMLYSKNYWKNYHANGGATDGLPTSYSSSNENKQGLLIDLTTPSIKFGNGNFEVNQDGHLTAKGGGEIAGWKISDTKLYSSANVSTGNPKITMDSDIAAIYSNNKNEVLSTRNGFYIGSDGFALGAYNSARGHNPFQVSNEGFLIAEYGTVGGWNMDVNSLTGGTMYLLNTGAIGNTNGTWSITPGGVATFTNVYITNDASVNTRMAWGNFSVDTGGNLNATNANFTGAIRSGSSISGSSITGSSINGNTITGGIINVNTARGGYLHAGTDTTHVDVSGLNVTTNAGIQMNQHNIGGCSMIYNYDSSLSVVGSEVFLRASAGAGHIGFFNAAGTEAISILNIVRRLHALDGEGPDW